MAERNLGTKQRLESRSLGVAMWGNLFMALAGLVAGVLSNSNAILMDGLFSLIGFGSALLARRITGRINAGPDKARPLGYAADEAIFSTFRALSLLGLLLFAVTNAIRNIYNYIAGMTPEPLNFAPMIFYFTIIALTCAVLWAFHYFTWRRTGKASAILRLEAKAALFDGVITVAAGAGLAAIYYFRDGPLAPIAPVGDSVIVLMLCLLAIGSYVREFRGGLGELAGASANPAYVATARRALRPSISEDGGILRDMSVTKLGRTFLVMVYYDPGRPVSAADIDTLNLRMIRDARQALEGADVYLVITQYPRRWPEELNPYGSD
ncbi:cation transporter [Salipiger sp. CCB-MM3]|uniref:cation transporter n=1 Tax=Salipiger sp. CCB-MM3 TaxID=1792508 RepID=UPI000AA8DA0A|nr:cation transporter [Salipiger sp. CCB-MM3]